MKKDVGKPTYSLALGYFPKALGGVNEVSLFGAKKYEAFGWKDWVTDLDDAIARYKEGLNRHLLAIHSREEIDPESGFPHIWHVAWNALAIAELEIEKENNEPKRS